MKKHLIIIALLVNALCFSACQKTEEETWKRFYGYTQADIVGHYEANPDSTYYSGLPTEGVVVYPNATIDITSIDSNLVQLRIIIPDVINKTFTGAAVMNENDSDLAFHNNNEDILMTVYKNVKNQVRLHGRESRVIYNADGEITDRIPHYFDVIKTSK